MIHINNDKYKNIDLSNCYVIADFDHTISSKDSNTTFSLYSKSGLYPQEYLMERNKNYNHYRPLELDLTIGKEEKTNIVKEWQESSYNLLLKYRVKESDIPKILNSDNGLKLRKGVVNFINKLNKSRIPLIISSAGLGNFIIEELKRNNCYSDNIYVYANMMKFKNDVIIDNNNKIIHSMNKNEVILDKEFMDRIINKKYVIIIGDQLSDLYMAKNLPKNETISFGFLESNVEDNINEFNKYYDVVLTDNESFNSIMNLINL